MKKAITRILALLLALMMVFSLAACGESDGGKDGDNKGSNKENDRVTPVVKNPKDDPAGYLAMALENTMNDLAERYSGSPLLAVANLIDTKGTVKVSGDVRVDNTTVNIKDISVGYDLNKKTFLVSADVAAQGMEVEGGIVFSPDFLGVSFPMLLGDSTYYGFKPKDLRKQLENSPLYDALGGNLSNYDWEQIDLLDNLLDILWDSEYIDIDKMVSEMESLSMDYIKDLDVDYEEDSFKVDGKKVDGYVFTATITSKDLAKVMEKMFDVMLDMPMWETLQKIAELGGEELDMDDLYDQIDDILRDIRRENFEIEVTYYVADEKVVKTQSVYDEYDMEITIDFYDDGNITADVDFDGASLTVTSVVESGKKGYTHTITMVNNGDGWDENSTTISCEWDGEDLELTLANVRRDGNYGYDESITITCGLSTSKKGFTLEDLTMTQDYYYPYYDEKYHDKIDIPLTIEYTSGGSVSVPKNTKNILEMSEKELQELMGNIEDLM